jgi:hypothetical protein
MESEERARKALADFEAKFGGVAAVASKPPQTSTSNKTAASGSHRVAF